MNKIIPLGIAAALIGASSYAMAASNLGVGTAASAATSATGTVNVGSNPSANVKAGAGLKANGSLMASNAGASANTYGSVISSIHKDSSVNLGKITDQGKVSIVLLSNLKGNASANAKALDKTLASNKTIETKLQTEIASNSAIMAKLQANKFTANQVVAVKTTTSGWATVYVDDRA